MNNAIRQIQNVIDSLRGGNNPKEIIILQEVKGLVQLQENIDAKQCALIEDLKESLQTERQLRASQRGTESTMLYIVIAAVAIVAFFLGAIFE